MFMERFAKVLNHLFQFVGITSTQRLRDKDFNSVLQAAVRRGHRYLLSNAKRLCNYSTVVLRFDRPVIEGNRNFRQV
jgi:hypothetical protein